MCGPRECLMWQHRSSDGVHFTGVSLEGFPTRRLGRWGDWALTSQPYNHTPWYILDTSSIIQTRGDDLQSRSRRHIHIIEIWLWPIRRRSHGHVLVGVTQTVWVWGVFADAVDGGSGGLALLFLFVSSRPVSMRIYNFHINGEFFQHRNWRKREKS